jgi:hypothetical protein
MPYIGSSSAGKSSGFYVTTVSITHIYDLSPRLGEILFYPSSDECSLFKSDYRNQISENQEVFSSIVLHCLLVKMDPHEPLRIGTSKVV